VFDFVVFLRILHVMGSTRDWLYLGHIDCVIWNLYEVGKAGRYLSGA
jgi:hypothetical protein